MTGDPAGELGLLLKEWDPPVFATVDGASFDDAPHTFAQAGIQLRSLFVEHRDPATVRAGPYLAVLDRPRLGPFLRIDGIADAAVFWRTDATEPILFRHLRSINLVDIPRDPAPPDQAPAPKTRTVLFRHYDPSVMAIVLRVLTPAQRPRLFGPADAIALYTASVSGARSAKRQPDWPKPEPGRLRLTPEQMGAVAAGMDLRSRHKIAAFLRETLPEQTAQMDDADLLNAVTRSEAMGRVWGVRTEAGFGRFAWLMFATGGRFAGCEPAHNFVTAGDGTPNHKLKLLMDAMILHLSQ